LTPATLLIIKEHLSGMLEKLIQDEHDILRKADGTAVEHFVWKGRITTKYLPEEEPDAALVRWAEQNPDRIPRFANAYTLSEPDPEFRVGYASCACFAIQFYRIF
jgi:hypothetical protein